MRALLLLFCLLLLAPFAALAHDAFSSFDLALWSLHLVELKAVLWSLLWGLIAALLTTLLGAALAYQVCFHDFPLRRLCERLLVLPLLIPTFVLAVVYRELFAASGTLARVVGLPAALSVDFATAGGYLFAICFSLFPFTYLLSRVAFESHGHSFLELGRSLGLSFGGAFVRILVPLSLPALLIGAGLVLVESAGDWATGRVLSVPSSAVSIHALWFERGAPQLASQLAFLFVAAALLGLLPLSRWLRRQRTAYLSAVVDTTPGRVARSGRRGRGWWRLLLCGLPALIGFVIPAATLLAFFVDTVGNVDLTALIDSSLDTVQLIAAVIGICLLFTALFSIVHRTTRGRATGLALLWFGVSYLIPASVVAVGSLLLSEWGGASAQRWTEAQAFWLLAFTLSARLVCFVLVPVVIGLSFVSKRVEDLGASLGLGPLQTFVRLHLPQLRGFALLGLMLLVVQVLRETAISIVLHPFSFQTLVLKAYAYIDIDLLPESASWVLATALVGLYPLLTVESLLSRRGRQRS